MKPATRMSSVDKLASYACDGLHGRHWYRDAVAQIDFVCRSEGWNHNEFAGVLATTSPRCSVVRNIRMSLHFMHYRDERVVPMEGIRVSLRKFLNDRKIDGQKIKAFYANLTGCMDAVTLDVWMAYALGIDQAEFKTIANRLKATKRIVSVGRILGIAPCEAQAAIWTGYRKRAGYAESPFSVANEYLAARANGWVIPGCNV